MKSKLLPTYPGREQEVFVRIEELLERGLSTDQVARALEKHFSISYDEARKAVTEVDYELRKEGKR